MHQKMYFMAKNRRKLHSQKKKKKRRKTGSPLFTIDNIVFEL